MSSLNGLKFVCRQVWLIDVLIELFSFNRPLRSCGKVMFLHLSVILFTEWGRCLPQCMLGYTHSPRKHTPRSTPQKHTPLEAHPSPLETPPRSTPLGRHPSLWADTSLADGYCSGRYASYWNVFLFLSDAPVFWTFGDVCREFQWFFIASVVTALTLTLSVNSPNSTSSHFLLIFCLF